MKRLRIQDKDKIERIGYVVFNSEYYNSYKEDYIYKVKEVRVNNSDSISIFTIVDSSGKTNNGCNADFFRFPTTDEVRLYELCKEPVHINQLNIIGDLSLAKKDQLIDEAKKRGYVKGVLVVHLTDGLKKEIEGKSYTYYEDTDTLYIGDIKIYRKGKWAEMVGETFNADIPVKFYSEYQKAPLRDDWYKKVKVGDWIRCVEPFRGEGYKGVAWRKDKEYEVIHITASFERYIFVVESSGNGVIHTACVPIEKPVDVTVFKQRVHESIFDKEYPISHPMCGNHISNTKRVLEVLGLSKVKVNVLPMNIVKRRKVRVKIEILESSKIVELLIKKRKKR